VKLDSVEGRRTLGRCRHKSEDNIKMYEIHKLRMWTASGSGVGPVAGSCEHGNESLGSIKGGKFLD